MPLYVYEILFAVLLLGGGTATMVIGFSTENQEGNPNYDKRTKSILKRLSLFYVIAIPLGFIALIVYILNFVL